MENTNQTNTPKAKKGYSTVLSKMANTVFMVLLLSLLAWLLLMFWFGISLFFKSGSAITARIVSIEISNREFIVLHYHAAFEVLLSWVWNFQNIMQYSMTYTLDLMNILLQKIHHQTPLASKEISLAANTIMFGTLNAVFSRLIIFVMHLPILMTFIFIAVVDGLGQRDVRKHQGARESTFFFHRVNPLTGKLFYLGFLIYMSMPLVFTPTYILLPMAIILSVLTMISIKGYKKYV
jgi:integrating conjugative element membrane protein (TIGR03747 family)